MLYVLFLFSLSYVWFEWPHICTSFFLFYDLLTLLCWSSWDFLSFLLLRHFIFYYCVFHFFYTVKKKGSLRNLKRIFTWIHGQILFMVLQKKGFARNLSLIHRKNGFVRKVQYETFSRKISKGFVPIVSYGSYWRTCQKGFVL